MIELGSLFPLASAGPLSGLYVKLLCSEIITWECASEGTLWCHPPSPQNHLVLLLIVTNSPNWLPFPNSTFSSVAGVGWHFKKI